MTDGGSGVKQFTGEVAQAAIDVVKDIKDSVGQAIEQGVQSVVGTQITPQQIQQKQQEEKLRLVKVRRNIAWYKNLDEEQKRVREANRRKETQRLQIQEEIPPQIGQTTQTPKSTKKPGQLPEEVLRTQAEFKPGKGVGG